MIFFCVCENMIFLLPKGKIMRKLEKIKRPLSLGNKTLFVLLNFHNEYTFIPNPYFADAILFLYPLHKQEVLRSSKMLLKISQKRSPGSFCIWHKAVQYSSCEIIKKKCCSARRGNSFLAPKWEKFTLPYLNILLGWYIAPSARFHSLPKVSGIR